MTHLWIWMGLVFTKLLSVSSSSQSGVDIWENADGAVKINSGWCDVEFQFTVVSLKKPRWLEILSNVATDRNVGNPETIWAELGALRIVVGVCFRRVNARNFDTSAIPTGIQRSTSSSTSSSAASLFFTLHGVKDIVTRSVFVCNRSPTLQSA